MKTRNSSSALSRARASISKRDVPAVERKPNRAERRAQFFANAPRALRKVSHSRIRKAGS